MQSKVYALLAVFWMWCAMHLYAQSVTSPYLFDHFDTDDGLPSNFSNAVVQDSLGFLWFLHDNGLSRYDGYNFKVYLHDSTDHMRLIGTARSGMLLLDNSKNPWVIYQQIHELNDKLTLSGYDRKKDSFIKYFPATKEPVSHISFDKSSPTIWMGTFSGQGLLNFNIETGETINYLNGVKNESVGSNRFIFLHDRDSVLLLASKEGLWNFNKATKKFQRPVCHPRDSSLLYHSTIVFILSHEEEPDYLWLIMVGAQHKLVKVDRNFSIVHLETHAPLNGEFAVIDQDGSLWFTTHAEGLYKYNSNDSSMIKVEETSNDQNGLRSSFLRGLTIDRGQNIWVTTNDRGISKIKKQNPVFHNYNLKGEITSRMIYDKYGEDHLVISKTESSSAKDNEILLARILPKELGSINFQRIKTEENINGRVNELSKGRNKLWLGTPRAGIVSLPIDQKTGMIQSGPMERLDHNPENPNTISHWGTTGLWEDPSGNLWAGTMGNGLNKVDLKIPYGKEGSVTRFSHIPGDSSSLSNDVIWRDPYPRNETSIYVITASGIDLFLNGSFVPYFKNKNSMTMQKDSKGRLLIGTTGGLFESNENSIDAAFTKIPSAALNKYGAFAMQEDRLGRLWITNHHGLVCYDRKEGNSIVFTEADGVDYSRDWIGKTSDGIMITSDPHGITLFDPGTFIMNNKNPVVVLTALTVNNQNPVIGETASSTDEFRIKSDITILNELTLDYKHNNFTFEFSAMEMTSPEKNLYRHKLEGYDNDWIETDAKNRTATYTNLDAGNYKFKVRASNHHGIWSDQEATLAVRILPPPWKTWWAYSLYGAAFIGIFLYWRSYENKRLILKHRTEHLSELDTLKTRFFANISHEFRTPITLILGPLMEMYNKTTNADQKTTFGIMIRNGQRLLRLINQLLDLSKLEAAKMQLHTSPVDLVQFLREIASAYESLAADKKIKYLFYPEVPELTVYIDQEKIEKVAHNLLSNAFKFTRESGEVILYLKVQNNQAVIVVKDTGIGIPSAQVHKVFDRFYQADNSQTRGYEGSGLGMALAKELVELHRGKISVESTYGKGTTFTVLLPLGKAHLNQEEIVEAEPLKPEKYSDVIISEGSDVEITRHPEMSASEQKPVLLIVEDNTDMRNFIRKILSEHYQIIEAENGNEGVEKANEIIPDLIISDIMMPEMDGYKLCENIKTNELTSHIPVILLTAKADHKSKLSGLEIGADDYLSKPFATDELKLIVRNRIEERRKMRARFSREVTLEPKQIAITSLDEKFLTKVLAIIEDHMDDENFSIEDFSREAGFSNIHFYRKIKALSGQTPSLFLRTIRLKRAAELLSKNSDNVSQIAYSVGFGSLSYFNKCFKEQFGMTPGQYAEAKSKV